MQRGGSWAAENNLEGPLLRLFHTAFYLYYWALATHIKIYPDWSRWPSKPVEGDKGPCYYFQGIYLNKAQIRDSALIACIFSTSIKIFFPAACRILRYNGLKLKWWEREGYSINDPQILLHEAQNAQFVFKLLTLI